MRPIPQAAADAFLVAPNFLVLLLRYSFTFLILSPVFFADRRQVISLLEPGIAVSKLTRRSLISFAKSALESTETSG